MTAPRALLLVALYGGVCAAHAPAAHADVTVASGKLEHHFMTNDLFHIDELWMQVESDTVFHRWLSQGINDHVAITLTTDPGRFGDRPSVKILTGKMMRGVDPGTSPIVHMIFLRDELTGSLGAVTFETDDPVTALKFDGFDDTEVSIVIEIK